MLSRSYDHCFVARILNEKRRPNFVRSACAKGERGGGDDLNPTLTRSDFERRDADNAVHLLLAYQVQGSRS